MNFADKYRRNYNRFVNKADDDLYFWLTKNMHKIQKNVGNFGIMEYIAPHRTHSISNYALILNTLPKFRNGKVNAVEINSVDDCLLRYIGYLEDLEEENQKEIKNPIIWFRKGIFQVLSIPLLIFKSFGILTSENLNNIKESMIYHLFTGIIALVSLISGLVTIIVEREQVFEYLKRILNSL